MNGKQAVESCVASMRHGMISERQINDVLRCRNVDVSPIEPFLADENNSIRMAAVRIVGEKGNLELLIDNLKDETTSIMFVAMDILGRRGGSLDGFKNLVFLLESDNSFIRDEAVAMFRRAHREDLLFSLMFSESETVVSQVKGYMNE